MKPAPFDYYAPTEVAEALSILAEHGDDAKLLAGGQSLMPMMNMRLATPQVVVDINRIAGLDGVRPLPDGGLIIGAMTRQRMIERSSDIRQHCPLMADAMPLLGHFQIRNRGTIGGSVVHADPAAELPAVLLALDAELVLRNAERERVVPADAFFVTFLTTATEPDELLMEIRLPAWSTAWGWNIQEVSRRQGDFALVGSVAMVQVDEAETCREARLVLFGVGDTPVRVASAEAKLVGQRLDDALLQEVADIVTEALEPEGDIHASATYRKEVGGVMARRTLQQARLRAMGAS
jgi:CO/xanthine dehydrogenase FAD-binding subunit